MKNFIMIMMLVISPLQSTFASTQEEDSIEKDNISRLNSIESTTEALDKFLSEQKSLRDELKSALKDEETTKIFINTAKASTAVAGISAVASISKYAGLTAKSLASDFETNYGSTLKNISGIKTQIEGKAKKTMIIGGSVVAITSLVSSSTFAGLYINRTDAKELMAQMPPVVAILKDLKGELVKETTQLCKAEPTHKLCY